MTVDYIRTTIIRLYFRLY